MALTSPGDHPWFAQETLWLVVLLALVLCCLALFRDFFLDTVVILFSAFFLQRILVIYIWPDQLDYQHYLYIARETMTLALVFTLFCAGAVWVGSWFANSLGRRRLTPARMTATERVRILGKRIPFETLFRLYAVVAIPLSSMRLFLLFTMNMGVAGYLIGPEYAVLSRLSFLTGTTSIIAFLLLLIRGTTLKTKQLAILLLALNLALEVFSTAKGAFVTLFLALLVCLHFAGKKIQARYAWYAGAFLLIVVVFYAPLALNLRGALLEGMGWGEAVTWLTEAPFHSDLLLGFLRRLNGLDLLVGFMTVGRDTFPGFVSLRGDVILLLNSLVPGEIIPQQDWVSPAYLIPFHLRGVSLPAEGALTAYGENYGLLGMGYVYFGWIGGVILMFVWSAVTTLILGSRIGRIYKILYFYLFVIVLFVGGGFFTPGIRFYESLISLGIAYALYMLCYRIGPYCVGKRRMHLLHATLVSHQSMRSK